MRAWCGVSVPGRVSATGLRTTRARRAGGVSGGPDQRDEHHSRHDSHNDVDHADAFDEPMMQPKDGNQWKQGGIAAAHDGGRRELGNNHGPRHASTCQAPHATRKQQKCSRNEEASQYLMPGRETIHKISLIAGISGRQG